MMFEEFWSLNAVSALDRDGWIASTLERKLVGRPPVDFLQSERSLERSLEW